MVVLTLATIFSFYSGLVGVDVSPQCYFLRRLTDLSATSYTHTHPTAATFAPEATSYLHKTHIYLYICKCRVVWYVL